MVRKWSDKKWARHGPEHSQWKGGMSKDKLGYVKRNINLVEEAYHCMCDSSGWVLEHRYQMAKSIGRPLTRNELVHHKDHNISNNEIDNLELTTRSEHMRKHESWKKMRPEYVKETQSE